MPSETTPFLLTFIILFCIAFSNPPTKSIKSELAPILESCWSIPLNACKSFAPPRIRISSFAPPWALIVASLVRFKFIKISSKVVSLCPELVPDTLSASFLTAALYPFAKYAAIASCSDIPLNSESAAALICGSTFPTK